MDRQLEVDAAGQDGWATTIRPTSGWFDLRLGDLWTYRDLILLFVRQDLVSIYKQTVLGPAWFLLAARGGVRFLLGLGASPANLHEVDLSGSRIKAAREINPAIDLTTSRGDLIPFPADAFDIVMQVVVFSLIVDRNLANLC